MSLTPEEQRELDFLNSGVPVNQLNPDEQAELDYLNSNMPEPVQEQSQYKGVMGQVDNFAKGNTPLPHHMELASNIPSSAEKYVVDTVQGVKSLATTPPLETLQGIRQLLNGVAEFVGFNPFNVDLRSDEAVAMVADDLTRKYGSIEAFGSTLKKDPVGVLANLSMVTAPIGGKLGKLGNQLDPLNLAVKGAGKTAEAIGKSRIPKLLMDTAAKPPVKYPNMSETLLKENIPLTRSGIDKAKGIVSEEASTLHQLLTETPFNNETLDFSQLSNFYKPTKEFSDNYLSDITSTNVNKTNKIVNGIRSELPNNEAISLRDAVDLRRNLQSEANWDAPRFEGKIANDYKEGLSSKINEAIDRRVLEVEANNLSVNPDMTPYKKPSDLNARMSSLIDVEKPLERSVNRVQNRSLLSPSTFMSGGLGYLAGGPVGFLVGELLNDPRVQSKAARLLYQGKDLGNKGPLVKPPAKTILDIYREQEEFNRQLKEQQQ